MAQDFVRFGCGQSKSGYKPILIFIFTSYVHAIGRQWRTERRIEAIKSNFFIRVKNV